VALVTAAETKLENFADDLGSILGHAQNKAESWLGQRHAIAEQLKGIRDTATRLLSELGIVDAPQAATRRGRVARRGPAAVAAPKKRKRTMSAEARAKISAAQVARWAKQKKAKG
jgi:hypothetical protein